MENELIDFGDVYFFSGVTKREIERAIDSGKLATFSTDKDFTLFRKGDVLKWLRKRNEHKDFFTYRECLRYADLSISTIRKAIKEGHLDTYKDASGCVHIQRICVDWWLSLKNRQGGLYSNIIEYKPICKLWARTN